MEVPHPLRFDAPDLAAALARLDASGLDALPYGVVEMDRAGTVLRYNATESNGSGLPPERVVGRSFFRDVAPCSNNRHVAGRYAADTLDETLDYTFALRMRPVPVTLRLLKPDGEGPVYLLVRWS